ncbi:hypothetical protein ACHAWC_010858 [Mediolabrus comicus]
MVRNACFLLMAACLCAVDAFTSTTTSCLLGKISSSFDKLVCCSSSVFDENEEYACIINRRELFAKTLSAPLFIATRASASNLPQSTGADLSKTGSIDTLVPIVAIKQGLESVKSQLMSKSADAIILPEECQSILKTLLLQSGIPRNENDFKKIFDAYSTKVSYKQKFLDQNAFLVYYTNGFDGPGRPNIEDDANAIQTLQYGARNDAWLKMDDLFVELEYGQKSNDSELVVGELTSLVQKVTQALDAYLSLAPAADVEQASVIASRR